MKKTILCVPLALLVACGSNRSDAEKAVRSALKDPESAKFGEFYFNENTKKGCLGVNAKNSMGGYTGEQQAFLVKTEKGWLVLGIDEISPAGCGNVADRKD